MKHEAQVPVIASTVLAVCLSASVLLLSRIDQLRSTNAGSDELYLSSPTLLKRISLGYQGLLADIYWTRVVQYYGSIHHAGGGDYKLLWPLLDITTQLDPQLKQAYDFGGAFLSAKPPNGAGLPDRAIQLVEYGIQQNPNDWHLYRDLGFIRYDLQDYAGAADAFLRGSRLPGAHPFMALLAARMAEHGGDIETSRMIWTATFQSSNDKDIRANAVSHLKALQVDQDVTELERRAQIYHQHFKRFPESFADMVRAGLLRGIPVDPNGEPYKLGPSGKVLVSDPDNLPFIQKGLPLGYIQDDIPKNVTAK